MDTTKDTGALLTSDGSPDNGPTPTSDGGTSAEAGSPKTFDLTLTIEVDPQLDCAATDTNKDCKGPLAWGLWTAPATSSDPGQPLHLGILPVAGHGTVIEGTGLPLAPQMYLNLFIDDNDSATVENALPDQGDLIHMDLDPFSASQGSTVQRTIVLWVRMP